MSDGKTGIDYAKDRWVYTAGVERRKVGDTHVTEVHIKRSPRWPREGADRYALFTMPDLNEEQQWALQQGLRGILRQLHVDDRTAVRSLYANVRRKSDGKVGRVRKVNRKADMIDVFGEYEPADDYELAD